MAIRTPIRRGRQRSRQFVELTGPARLDRRTKHLVKRLSSGRRGGDRSRRPRPRLRRGADRVGRPRRRQRRAVDHRPVSRTPARSTLVRGGVWLLDVFPAPLFDELADGELVTVRPTGVYRGSERIATGRLREEAELEDELEMQKTRLAAAIESFAENTMRYMREEGRELAEGASVHERDHPLPRPPCARRRAGARVQARPRHRPAVHP